MSADLPKPYMYRGFHNPNLFTEDQLREFANTQTAQLRAELDELRGELSASKREKDKAVYQAIAEAGGECDAAIAKMAAELEALRGAMREAVVDLQNYRQDCESYEAPEGIESLEATIAKCVGLVGDKEVRS